MGFYRGLWIPLMTISFVRECYSVKYIVVYLIYPAPRYIGAASFTIYSRTKEYFAYNDILYKNTLVDVALTGGISGAMSGALISFGSARECSPVPLLASTERRLLILRVELLNWSRLAQFLTSGLGWAAHECLDDICVVVGSKTTRILHRCEQGYYHQETTRDVGRSARYLSGKWDEGALHWVSVAFR